ncbi:hypothetical protein [Gemmata sp.]|uniref:hypothetical protein n=1 Tax=Gemmata sp. TaxID=1914242 RepID=UPI003F7144AB
MRFTVRVRGHNFLIPVDGESDPRPHSFFTQVDVEADNEEGAETAAIQLLRQTQKLRDLVRNTRDDPPRMDVEGLCEYESGPVPPLAVEPSFIWFPDDGTDDSDGERQ